MTQKLNDGGPAFPQQPKYNPNTGDLIWYGEYGMTLRDWFAGQAMCGHLASLNPSSWGNDTTLAFDAAKGAYLVADAMLKAREADNDK